MTSEVEEGTTNAVFTCEITEVPEVTSIYWTKDSVSLNTATVTSSGGLKYSGGTVATPSLTINEVTRKDKGLYSCVAINSKGTGSSLNVSLIVTYPPTITCPVTTVVGQRESYITLICDIDAYPALTSIIWVKDGINLDLSHHTPGGKLKYTGGTINNPNLTIHNIDDNYDPGRYSCEATNPRGTVSSDAITVKVSCLPLLFFPSTTMTIVEGETIALQNPEDSTHDIGLRQSVPGAEAALKLQTKDRFPIFGTEWQFSRPFTDQGGNLQCYGSDVVLTVPPKAVPKDRTIDVYGAIFTDVPHIRERFNFSDDEKLATPVVEYTVHQSSKFERNVVIRLPHALPPDFDNKDVKVYTYSVNVYGDTMKTLVCYGRATDGIFWEEDKAERKICITTSHFSGYYCIYCGHKGRSSLWGVVFGSYTKLQVPKTYSIRIILNVYGCIYGITDFWTSKEREQESQGRQSLTEIKDIPLLADSEIDYNSFLAMKLCVIQPNKDYWRHTFIDDKNYVFPPLQVKRIRDVIHCCLSMQDIIKIEWDIENDQSKETVCQDFNCAIVAAHLPASTPDHGAAIDNYDNSLKQTFLVRGFRATRNGHSPLFPPQAQRTEPPALPATSYMMSSIASDQHTTKPKKGDFDRLIVRLSRNLHDKSLVKELAWLTGVDYESLEDDDPAERLLERLIHAGKISENNCIYLKYPLRVIGRRDLAALIPTPETVPRYANKVNEGRVILHGISKKLKEKDIRNLSVLVGSNQPLESALSLFVYMVRKEDGDIPELKVAKKLVTSLKVIDRLDLASDIETHLSHYTSLPA